LSELEINLVQNKRANLSTTHSLSGSTQHIRVQILSPAGPPATQRRVGQVQEASQPGAQAPRRQDRSRRAPHPVQADAGAARRWRQAAAQARRLPPAQGVRGGGGRQVRDASRLPPRPTHRRDPLRHIHCQRREQLVQSDHRKVLRPVLVQSALARPQDLHGLQCPGYCHFQNYKNFAHKQRWVVAI